MKTIIWKYNGIIINDIEMMYDNININSVLNDVNNDGNVNVCENYYGY